MQYFRLTSFALVLALTGCSAIVSPDGSALDPGGPADAGADAVTPPTDSSVPDTAPSDSAPPPSDSAPPPVDSSPPPTDGAPPPVDSSPPPDGGCSFAPRCEAGVLILCDAGVERRFDCAAGGEVCNSDTISCDPATGCVPGSRRCLSARESAVCNADGLSETPIMCPFSCSDATGACVTDPPPPACSGLPTVGGGDTHRVDLCSQGDDDTHMMSEGCPAGSRADSGDTIFELTVDRRRRVVIDLRDDDDVAIDTIVYVRTSCEAGSAQVACSDDIPCSESDITSGCFGGGGGTQVRQSIIDQTFEPGTYYIVVDAFEYSTDGTRFECGRVRLNVEFP